MSSISNIVQQSNPYEKYVQLLVQIKSQNKVDLQNQKSDISDQKAALGTVSSVVSSFISKIDELKDATQNNFSPLKADSSNTNAVRVDSISGMKQPNNYDITVDRVASKDIMLSNVITGSNTDLATQGDGSLDVTIGGKTQTISVSTTKIDGSGNVVNKTNKEILQSFSTAINDALGTESDSDVFNIDNNDNIQLSIKSANTGYDQRIQFSNATGVLASVTGNMTHNTTPSNLDAQFTVDGITFSRGQNKIEDVIPNMTFTLVSGTGTKEQISVEKDLQKARDNIDGFIKAFNDMNSKIRNRTFINGQTGNTGPLQNMRSIRNLTIDLRQMALTNMSSAAPGEINNLSDIGIGFDKDGTMKIEDSDLLDNVLSNNPDQVNKLFTDSSSPVTAMYKRAKNYTESGGIITSLEDGLQQKIDFLDNRIESEDKYLKKYEERQRKIFSDLYQMQQQSQRQLNSVTSQQQALSL